VGAAEAEQPLAVVAGAAQLEAELAGAPARQVLEPDFPMLVRCQTAASDLGTAAAGEEVGAAAQSELPC
jgi:hypothetical protein